MKHCITVISKKQHDLHPKTPQLILGEIRVHITETNIYCRPVVLVAFNYSDSFKKKICYSTYTLYKHHSQNNGGQKGPLRASGWVVAEDCAKIQK